MTDKTIDDLSPISHGSISDTNDFFVVRTGSPLLRQSRKISVSEVRSLMFRGFSSTAMDILFNVTADSSELNVLDGVLTGSGGVTPTRINYLAGVSPGVSEANKVLVLGSDRQVNHLRITELFLRNETESVQATAAELNRLSNVPNGLTKTDLGNLPILLELFLSPSVVLNFPDFSTISNGDDFNITVSGLHRMRGSPVGVGMVNVRLVLNGATSPSGNGGIREELNDSVGQTTLVFQRGAVTNATQVNIVSGTNTYRLELTFRGIKYTYEGTFVGSSSSSVNPPLE